MIRQRRIFKIMISNYDLLSNYVIINNNFFMMHQIRYDKL